MCVCVCVCVVCVCVCVYKCACAHLFEGVFEEESEELEHGELTVALEAVQVDADEEAHELRELLHVAATKQEHRSVQTHAPS